MDCGLPRRLDSPNQQCNHASTCRLVLGFFACDVKSVVNHVSNTTSKLDCTAEQVAVFTCITLIHRHRKLMPPKNVHSRPHTHEGKKPIFCSQHPRRPRRWQGRRLVTSLPRCLLRTFFRTSFSRVPGENPLTAPYPPMCWFSLVLPR